MVQDDIRDQRYKKKEKKEEQFKKTNSIYKVNK